MMGDKIEAKKIAKKYGLPIIEGSDGGVTNFDEAKKICRKIGYPILIKAAGGGGGKGMKVVTKEDEFEELFLTARTEQKQKIFLVMMKYILRNSFKIQDILKFKYCLVKIEQYIFMKEIVLFREDIRN